MVAPAPIPIPAHLAGGEVLQRFGRFLKLPPIQAAAFCVRFIGYIRISQRAQIPYISIFYGLN